MGLLDSQPFFIREVSGGYEVFLISRNQNTTPVVAAVCYTVLKNRRTILWQKKHDRKTLCALAMM